MPDEGEPGNDEFLAQSVDDAVRYVQEKYAKGHRFVEESGPAVEKELIRKCILQQLNPYATIDVTTRVLTFRPWFEAWKEILDEVRGDVDSNADIEP